MRGQEQFIGWEGLRRVHLHKDRLQILLPESRILTKRMAYSQQNFATTTDRRTKLIVGAVILVAASVIGGIFYLLMRASGRAPEAPVTLAGGAIIRKDSPDFAKYNALIVHENLEADEKKRMLGDTLMTLTMTVRNFTGKTINGLEVWAAVVDHQDKPVKESTRVVIPTDQAELEPNKNMKVYVTLEGMTDKDDRANIKMEVVGFRFKQ